MEKNDGTKIMDNDLYEAAVKGDSTILANATVGGDECTETKANLIHIAVRHERYDFIETTLGKFPHLLCQRNSDDNTPFHIAAEVGNTRILDLLVNSYNKAALEGLAPWREKNLQGNTPLHVALIHAKLQLANNLVVIDPELTAFVNKSKETPLHLAVRYRFIDDDRESVLDAMKLVIGNTLGGAFMVQSPRKENSRDIIAMLLEKNPSIACWRDSNGFTPLLRAALFKIPDMSAIQSILKCCPRSIEVCDASGKTFFHLLAEHSHHDNSEYLLSIRETIHSLKDRQDFEGNTPSYLAVKNRNISMVRLLFRVSANFAIKTKEGVSAADLLRQQSDEFHNLLIDKQGGNLLIPCSRIEKEEERLQNLLSKLQQKGTIEEELFGDNLRGGNVLHQLIYVLWSTDLTRGQALEDDDVQEFMKQALDSCPALICETDTLGGTPLHLIASYFHDFIDESVLGMFSYYFKKFEDEYGVEGLYLPPWRMKDEDGHTPLHAALRSSAPPSCFREFLKFDPELATYQNKEMETPLHLLDPVNLSTTSIEEVQDIRDAASAAASLYDNDGLTPLLKAAQCGHIELVKLLCLLDPWSVGKKTKNDEKTFWHLLASQTFFDSKSYRETGLEMLLEIRSNHTTVKCLAEADNDGNTPLHIAIEKRNFHFARFVMEIAPEDSFEKIMRKRNSKDLTPIDLIGSAEYVPHQFENFIWSNDALMTILLGARSLSGVPTAMVKDSTNTIGVIAALLATITFTAAFTVPGGLNSNDGTPFLMRKAAFQVFMVSDILAMCLSMMILFCLLWTMGNQRERVVILDLAIFLLQLAFYATLVAFMTGLYVTTFPIASWVAIFACTLCSLLILLMRERFVTSAIRPVIKIAFVSQKIAPSVKEFLYLLLCCFPKREMMRRSQQPSEIQKLKHELHEHDLVKTWRTNATNYRCKGCKKPGSNWAFYCKKCDFALHPECALKNREEDVMLSWIPKRIVTSCSEQPNETNDRGHRSPTHGDAHAEQVARPSPKWRTGVSYEKLKLKLHEHELVQMWRGQYGCEGCGKRGFNWSFYCKACDFDLHPECALKNDEKVEGECSKEVEATDEGFAKDDEIKAEANEGNTCELKEMCWDVSGKWRK